ncbi:thiol:disulfide interchange protein DsbD [Neiella marina]|uniref:Thiol:disulfide interchange protein DsbD n=1 Tax=Neiella marina TaxID=508461 RepID=A0A8J2U2Z8_9GAMM|nr:protein-disulfide reductase DsbD domain-containing protein [Neiella marina]GGA69210.1 thiol:disulfide interchange protein DsbD [Neiella marina]
MLTRPIANLLISCFSLLLLASPAKALTSGPQQHPHIEVELVAENQTWVPGTTQWLGLAMRPESHWHTYWKNPGDSGIATTFDFSINTLNGPESEAISLPTGNVAWPTPERIVISDITNFGYYHDSLLMVPVELPTTLNASAISVELDASWLVCKESCIPGDGKFQLTIPVANTTRPSAFATLFEQTRKLLPQQAQSSQLRFNLNPDNNEQIRFQYVPETNNAMPMSSSVDLFAANEQLIAAADKPQWQQLIDVEGAKFWQTDIAVSDYFYQLPQSAEVVLAAANSEGVIQGLTITAKQQALLANRSDNSADSQQQAQQSLVILMLMAFVGGILLNLMPCVFPVLSLKALSLVKLSGKAASQARLHGLLYSLGILASLTVLAAILTVMKQAGAAVGWGFQLQDPIFLTVLSLLMVLMAASLLGAFEVAGSWMSVGSERLSRGDRTASLLSGCLAVVVASPCMTPLMAPALGVALTLPMVSMFIILMALGLGLALPIIILTLQPKLIAKMPKPGPWLDTFKQALAFPLLLTALWLLWLLQQHDPTWVLVVLAILLIMSFCWWLKVRGYPKFATAVIVATVATTVALTQRSASDDGGLAAVAQPYSAQLLQQHLNQGEVVFVNMTADWCLTCKVNERVTFSQQTVAAVFDEHSIHYVVGDWTHRDRAISDYLDQFQHAGVPLYVLYNQRGEALVLPQILTPSTVVEYIETHAINI